MLGASATKGESAAISLPPEVLRGGSFTDLAWQGDAGDYSFDLGLRWDDGDVREARYTLDGGSGRPAYVKELLLRGGDGKILWAGIAPPGRPMRAQEGYRENEVRFTGLIPRDGKDASLRALADHMERLGGNVRWLDGVRARLGREVKATGVAPAQLATDGSNAAHFLIEQPELIHEVGRFYAELTPRREFEVKEILDVGYRILLNPSGRESFRIDLLDTGEGMTQVLPVLVAVALSARQGRSSILAVEEPESHLHPDAQSVLASYLCGIAARPNAPTLVLETHSRVFLLGVQLAVAEGRLSHQNVSLAWVDQDATGSSSITPVELTPSGHPRAGWPVAALAEDLRLATKLARLGIDSRG